MAARLTRPEPRALLAFAFALAAAPLRPAHAEVVVDGSSASTNIQAMSGEFLFEFASPVTEQQSPVVAFASNQEATPPGPFPATARSRQTASVVPSAGGLTVNADASAFARVPGAPEPPLSNLIAIASANFGISFHVTERATVTASAQTVGSNSPDGASITCASPGGEFVERLGASVSATVVLEAGGSCGVSATTIVDRNGNRDFQALGERTGTLRVNITVSELGPDDGAVFRYVGPAQGSFATAGNWENENGGDGVPGFRSFDDADTAVVDGETAVDLDLSGALARAGVPRGPGGTRQTGRLVVRSTQILRPLGGTLILDSLEPGLGERSLEVDGARLLLDQGGIAARHVVVGQGGDGELEVVGPNGFFTTLGRFGIGGDADGNVTIRGGAQVTSAESVVGEADGGGAASVEGAGTLWQTGNLAVGFADEAGLTVDGGARVESASAFVDCQLAEGEDVPGCSGLEGDERAEVVLGGGSEWALGGSLAVGARGKVTVEGGSTLAAVGNVEIGTSGNDADCLARLACVSVVDGSVTADGVKVGTVGRGKLEIGPAGRVTGAFGVLAGTGDLSDGQIVVRGPSAQAQLATVSTGLALGTAFDARGVLTLESGARATFGGVSTVGSVEDSRGIVDLKDGSVLRVEGATSGLRLGLDSAGDPPEPNAELLLSNATVELADADLDVLRTGSVTGVGSIVGSGVAIVSNNGRIGCGVLVDASYFQDATGVLDCPATSLPISPQLNPLAASRFARAVRARPVPPPPPPPGPFVVTGDATLGGTLVLQFLNGFAPSVGDAFELLDVGGAVTGSFADVSVRGLAPGADFAEDFVDGKLTVTSLTDAVSLPVVSVKGKAALREGKPKKGFKLKISRKGDTSQAIAVRYRLRGTAQNGFDYDLLPGVIEIPARKKSAKLALRAFADGATEGIESFELELLPGEGYTTSLFSKVATAIDDEKPKKR